MHRTPLPGIGCLDSVQGERRRGEDNLRAELRAGVARSGSSPAGVDSSGERAGGGAFSAASGSEVR